MEKLGKTIYEFEESGLKFGFKFGIFATYITEKECGVGINDLLKRLADPSKMTEATLQYFYGGAVAYNRSKGIDKKIDYADVADYLEILDERTADILYESLGMPKNSNAPTTGQQKETESKE